MGLLSYGRFFLRYCSMVFACWKIRIGAKPLSCFFYFRLQFHKILKMTDLSGSFSFRSRLTKWIYMHILTRSIENHNISLFYFSTNTVFHSPGAGLATANQIAPFHLLIHFDRLLSFIIIFK